MDEPKPKRQQTTADKVVGTVIVLSVIGLPIYWLASRKPVEPATTYAASVGTYRVLNPSSVEVEVTVKNTGRQAGKPFCTIEVSDRAGTYKGKESRYTNSSIGPGQTEKYSLLVPVGSEGAGYITQGNATCIEG